MLNKREGTDKEQLTLEKAYALYVGGSELKANTKERIAGRWNVIVAWFGATALLSDLDLTKIDGFKTHLKTKDISNRTANNHLATLKAVMRWCWKRELIASVPYIQLFPVKRDDNQFYTLEQQELFLKETKQGCPRWHLFFLLTCTLGLRAAEIYALKINDLVEGNQVAINKYVMNGSKSRPWKIVPGRKGKDEGYVCYVPDNIVQAWQDHVKAGYATGDQLFVINKHLNDHIRPMQRCMKAAQLPVIGHHKLGRRSVATAAIQNGVPLTSVQAALGHKSLASTMAYIRTPSDGQQRMMEALAKVRSSAGSGETGANGVPNKYPNNPGKRTKAK